MSVPVTCILGRSSLIKSEHLEKSGAPFLAPTMLDLINQVVHVMIWVSKILILPVASTKEIILSFHLFLDLDDELLLKA